MDPLARLLLEALVTRTGATPEQVLDAMTHEACDQCPYGHFLDRVTKRLRSLKPAANRIDHAGAQPELDNLDSQN